MRRLTPYEAASAAYWLPRVAEARERPLAVLAERDALLRERRGRRG